MSFTPCPTHTEGHRRRWKKRTASAFIIPNSSSFSTPNSRARFSPDLLQINSAPVSKRRRRPDQPVAGDEGSFNRRTTGSMAANKRAAKEPVAAGEECVMKRCDHAHGLMEKRKRKSEELAESDESAPKVCTIKKGKAAGISCSELKQGAMAKGEEAPGKKMARLPQEEIVSILAKVMDDERLPRDYRALKRHNPDLIPSPEEEMDEELVEFYDLVRGFYEVGEEFREFQAWVRSEYTKKGYVEVDDEFLARRAEDKALIEEARKEALKGFNFSHLID